MSQDYFQPGGTLGVDAKSYVERQADEDLFNNLCDGRFCYVLNGHQVGKSSLVNRVSQKLEEQNRTCVNFDLQSVTDLQLDELYKELNNAIIKKTQLDLDSLLTRESGTGARFQELIEIVSRHNQDRSIVIFLDEINYLLKIREPSDFQPSSFFEILKNLSDNHTKITFCVVGTASKKSLTMGGDVYQATPAIEFFNQGVSIELNGFRKNDVDPLIEGLKNKKLQEQLTNEEVNAILGSLDIYEPDQARAIASFILNSYKIAKAIAGAILDDQPDRAQAIVDPIADNIFLDDQPDRAQAIVNPIADNILDDQPDRAQAIANDILDSDQTAREIVYAILDETGGQPFLTQYFCDAIYKMRISDIPKGQESKKVQDLIQEAISVKTANDLHLFSEPLQKHLSDIKDIILYDDGLSRRRLQLYRNILLFPQKSVDFTENGDEYPSLLLSGIVQKEENKLKLYNPIYEKIFNLQWVNQKLKKSRDLKNDILRGVGILVFILVLRVLGSMQPLELFVYDRMLQMRQTEKIDETITVVTVNEKTLNNGDYATTYEGSKTLTDRTVYQILQKINQYNPKVIGLDIYRDITLPPDDREGGESLREYLRQNENIVSICQKIVKNPNPDENYFGAPTTVSSNQIGFADVPSDSQDSQQRDMYRRQFFMLSNNPQDNPQDSICNTKYPLSVQAGLRYLGIRNYDFGNDLEGYSIKFLSDRQKADPSIYPTTFHAIRRYQGGYYKFHDPKTQTKKGGIQILINYRDHNQQQPFNSIDLSDILNNSLDSEDLEDKIKDRIVLLGYGFNTKKDNHNTPYGLMEGVYVQAHMTSQIINAVKNNRSLLYAFNWWQDAIIISFFGVGLGTVIGLRTDRKFIRWCKYAVSIIIIYGACFIIIQFNGLWMPFVPLILGLVLSGEIAVHIDSISSWFEKN